MCRLLATKAAPPAAKRLVYSLCIKSQIRYPAGLAPWTTAQFLELDRIPRNYYYKSVVCVAHILRTLSMLLKT